MANARLPRRLRVPYCSAKLRSSENCSTTSRAIIPAYNTGMTSKGNHFFIIAPIVARPGRNCNVHPGSVAELGSAAGLLTGVAAAWENHGYRNGIDLEELTMDVSRRRHPFPWRAGCVSLGLLLLLSGCATVAERPAEPPDTAVIPELEDTEPDFYESISIYMSLGDPQAAIAAYEEARRGRPEDPRTRVLLSGLLLAAGQFETAASVLDAVLEAEPDNPDALFNRALLLGYDGETERQSELLHRVIERQPDNAQAHAALGENYLQRGRITQARAAFQTGLEYDPDNFVALVGLGNTLLRQREHQEAEKVLTRAVEIDPQYSFAWSDRGRARARQHNLFDAEQDLNRAIELQPDFSWHYVDRARVRAERRDFRGAIDDYTRAIALEPSVFLSYANRGRLYATVGESDRAYRDYTTALEMRPDYHAAFAPLGMLTFMRQEWERSAGYFRRAWQYEESQYGYPLLAALALRNNDDEAGARRYLNSVLNQLPRDTLYYDMARFYITPNVDSRLLRQIEQESNRMIKAQMYFLMGGHYELRGQNRLARTVYLQTEEQRLPQLIESQLATWALDQRYR
ncbi:MAG: tetratricopeptide repeat protein [Spirochaetaceae bacterium]|nr:MAG: tetratricopeptide repeat protein [Spirochaetaceae bacterium]